MTTLSQLSKHRTQSWTCNTLTNKSQSCYKKSSIWESLAWSAEVLTLYCDNRSYSRHICHLKCQSATVWFQSHWSDVWMHSIRTDSTPWPSKRHVMSFFQNLQPIESWTCICVTDNAPTSVSCITFAHHCFFLFVCFGLFFNSSADTAMSKCAAPAGGATLTPTIKPLLDVWDGRALEESLHVSAYRSSDCTRVVGALPAWPK